LTHRLITDITFAAYIITSAHIIILRQFKHWQACYNSSWYNRSNIKSLHVA